MDYLNANFDLTNKINALPEPTANNDFFNDNKSPCLVICMHGRNTQEIITPTKSPPIHFTRTTAGLYSH